MQTPTLLMAWRLAISFTQAELAASLRKLAADAGSPCSPSTPSCQQISRWENGHDRPGAFYQGLLIAWYRASPARLGLVRSAQRLAVLPSATDDTSPDIEDDVNRRSFLAVAAPVLLNLDDTRRRMNTDLRHVLPAAEVDHWIQIGDQHLAAYGTVPPALLLARLAPDLSDLSDLAGQYPRERELTRLTARLGGLTGALHTDLGHSKAARDWLNTAGRYAAICGDPGIRYWIAMAQAMTAAYLPDPARVLATAEQATAMLGPYRAAPTAQLAGLAARAHAELGESRPARDRLADAAELAAGLTAAQADEMFFGFPRREMDMYAALVLTELGDPAAQRAQADALDGYPAGDRMDRPLLLLCRARRLAREGEPEEGAQVAVSTIAALPPAWRVPLLVSEARSVIKAVAATSPQAGRQYSDALRDILSATAS